MIKTRQILCLPIVAALVLGGCATGPGSLQARYGDRNDVCYVDRQPLIETESRFSESMVAGGIGGALVGAGMGALLSGGTAKGVTAKIAFSPSNRPNSLAE